MASIEDEVRITHDPLEDEVRITHESLEDEVRITHEPLEVGDVFVRATLPSTGATSLFVGTTR